MVKVVEIYTIRRYIVLIHYLFVVSLRTEIMHLIVKNEYKDIHLNYLIIAILY